MYGFKVTSKVRMRVPARKERMGGRRESLARPLMTGHEGIYMAGDFQVIEAPHIMGSGSVLSLGMPPTWTPCLLFLSNSFSKSDCPKTSFVHITPL